VTGPPRGAAEAADRLRAGDPLALARAISWLERGDARGPAVLAAVAEASWPWVVGVTGAPGAGKSTLVDALVQRLALSGPVTVLAVDPSSPVTGGAVLGDRIRMASSLALPGVFVRSLASRGVPGGLADAAWGAAVLAGAAGSRVVVLETVGTGQAEVDVVRLADTVLLVFAPNMGDEVQALKAGVLELAHVLAVTKADLPGAAEAVRQLRQGIRPAAGVAWTPPVMAVSARTGAGLAELESALERHRGHLQRVDGRPSVRQRAAEARLRAAVAETAVPWLVARLGEEAFAAVVKAGARGASPAAAARRLWGRTVGEGEGD
jgi:LAO/AO transport system kinase